MKIKPGSKVMGRKTLEMEILSQCGDSTLRDFKHSRINCGKGCVVGQLIPVEYSRLTVSNTLTIEEPLVDFQRTSDRFRK